MHVFWISYQPSTLCRDRRGKTRITVCPFLSLSFGFCPFLSLFFLLLDILSAILFHTLNVQREWKWEAYEVEWILFCVFLLFFFFTDFISMVDPTQEPSSHGLADMIIHLGEIYTSSSTLLWLWLKWRVRNLLRERHRGIDGEREKVCRGIVELSKQVQMHWFRITFLFHLNRRMLPFSENAILISRLRPNICTIQIGGYGGNEIQTWNMALSSYPAQPYWCFWAFHCSAKMKSFRAGANDRLRKHILFCRTWQRLSCCLNNMSSAEVAWKHYLWNIV